MSEICIIDYGIGNLASVAAAFAALDEDVTVSGDPAVIERAEGLILPGVGAFAEGMHRLEHSGLTQLLQRRVVDADIPILGICLGMQLLARSSTEGGTHKGLGWLDADVIQIPEAPGLRVPHVGWNQVRWSADTPLAANIPDGTHFYFNHLFYMEASGNVATSDVDFGRPLVASVQQGNVFGVQFHPEKSQRNGLRLLRNFVNVVRDHRSNGKIDA